MNKIKQYQNKEWLEEKYWKEKLPANQIAKICNVTLLTIYIWMVKYNIPRRSKKEYISLRYNISQQNKKYCDKYWIYKQYWDKKLTLSKIAKLCGVNHVTIYHWMKKFNIPFRSHGYAIHLALANYCDLSKEAKDFIDGELLGDGSLQSRSNYSAKFIYTSKYKEYINYISKILKSFGIKQSGKIVKYYNKKRNCYTHHYSSCDYVELLPIYKKWYPSGKKIIPKDLELNPLILRQFYIGEGCLRHHKKGRPNIVLSTEAFVYNDIENLCQKLNKLDFKVSMHKKYNNHTIYISSYSTKDFLNYIDGCPVACYRYKWNY